MGSISNRIRTIGFSNLLAIGNLDRGWLVALVWTRAGGEKKMPGRFGDGSLRVQSGDCSRVLDSGTHHFHGDHHWQTFGFECLDRDDVFHGGRVHFLAGRSRGKICIGRY